MPQPIIDIAINDHGVIALLTRDSNIFLVRLITPELILSKVDPKDIPQLKHVIQLTKQAVINRRKKNICPCNHPELYDFIMRQSMVKTLVAPHIELGCGTYCALYKTLL